MKDPLLARALGRIADVAETIAALFAGMADAAREVVAGLNRVVAAKAATTFQSRRYQRRIPTFAGYDPEIYAKPIMRHASPHRGT